MTTTVHQDINGTQYTQDYQGGAALVSVAATDVAFPQESFLYFTGTAADVSDNTPVYVSGDVSMYSHHEFTVVTAPGAGAIECHISHDGTNWEATAIQVVDRSLVVGAAVQGLAQITAVGNYYVDGKFKRFRIVNNGATTGAAASVRGSHSVL